MPALLRSWLAEQLQVPEDDIYPTDTLLGLSDLLALRVSGLEDLLAPPHEPVDHPSLRRGPDAEPRSIFDEIRRGDILVHHPYQSFDSSVLRLISEAAEDPKVLAIKLTIYRTSTRFADHPRPDRGRPPRKAGRRGGRDHGTV